jgi:hypothetical protein
METGPKIDLDTAHETYTLLHATLPAVPANLPAIGVFGTRHQIGNPGILLTNYRCEFLSHKSQPQRVWKKSKNPREGRIRGKGPLHRLRTA